MTHRILQPDGWVRPRGYANCIAAEGRQVFVSGQIGSPIDDRSTLVAGLANIALPEPLVAPDTARGLYLEPFVIDRLDLAQPDGIHDRRHFEREGVRWSETVLVP